MIARILLGLLTSIAATPTIDGNASDIAVTIGSGAPTSCTITFHAAYGTYDHCNVSWSTLTAGNGYSYSLSAITLTGAALAGNVNYRCDGK